MAIAILTILIAAVGPSIATIVQRDKETELIFRGKQYARAILAFQKRYGRYPTELKELAQIKPRSIRQLWKEPMCNCDEGWQLIIAGTPDALPMGQGAPPPGGGMPGSGLPPTTPGRSQGNQPPSTYTGFGQPTPPPSLGGGGSAPTPTPAPFSTGIFGEKPKTVGPIVGVRANPAQEGAAQVARSRVVRRVAVHRRRRGQRPGDARSQHAPGRQPPDAVARSPLAGARPPRPRQRRRGPDRRDAGRALLLARVLRARRFGPRAGSAPRALPLPRAPALQAHAAPLQRPDRARDRRASAATSTLSRRRSTPGSTSTPWTRGSRRPWT